MAKLKPFIMDGIEYDVHVTKLTEKFVVMDTDKTGRTQDGDMYRDIIGTVYNYSMEIERSGSNIEDFDRLMDAMSRPTESHVCTFPHNQTTLTQRMYVTSGDRSVDLIIDRNTLWGKTTVNFIAMRPKVVP